METKLKVIFMFCLSSCQSPSLILSLHDRGFIFWREYSVCEADVQILLKNIELESHTISKRSKGQKN